MADVITEGKRKTEDHEEVPASKKAKDTDSGSEEETKESELKNGVEKVTLDLPDEDTLSSMPEENMKKTIDQLEKGKLVADKYVEALTRAYDAFADKNPEFFTEDQQTSLQTLQSFKEKMTDKKRNTEIEEDTKKAFAYHIEVCKAAMPALFNPVPEEKEPAEEKPEVTETPVEALFKKAPAVTMDAVYQVVNTGLTKLVREKKQLNDELQQLYEKMEISDESLRHQILESMGKEAEGCWRFLQENGEAIFEHYSKVGKSELVILSLCRDVVAEVIEKIILCRKNWTIAASALNKYSMGATALVDGPVVSAEQYSNKDHLIGLIPDNRLSLQQLLSDLKRKVDSSDKVIIDHEKSLIPEGGEASYDFILKELPSKLGRTLSKSLAVEEKLYIGYHLNVIKGCVGKMMELTIARKCLDGKYVFRKDAKGGHGHGRGRDYRSGRDDRHDGWKDRNRNRYGGGLGVKSGGQFDHRGSY